MKWGRAGRRRKRRKDRQKCQEADACAELRKWMVARSSKRELAHTFNLMPFFFPDTGRGLKTKRIIKSAAVIVSIPQCLLVTPSVVLNSQVGSLLKRWKVSFTPHQLLALFLIVERNKSINSEWQPFITSLPSEYTLPHYFSADEINLLPLHVSLVAQRMIQRSQLAHKQVLQFCCSHWGEDADGWSSWERFRWAWCTVSSRAIFFETEEEGKQFVDLDFKDENNVALSPYLDLLNHTSAARVDAGFNRQNKMYEIITHDNYQPHEQVFISYGPHDNATLFLHYGFTLPHNIHNSVCFSVDDFGILPDYYRSTERKLAELRKNGLHRELSCTMDGVSWNFMSAMKILALDWEQLQKSERVLTGEHLPPEVLLSARRMVRKLVSHALAKLRALLAQLPQEVLTAHGNIAHSLVSDDILILTVALQDVS
ncbi:SET domain-containing protein 4-like isoform X2 [Littorina saxatilis]|uniref:SET domain-containing protein n=2 Tax=Littorina saxatilis TaxID=31220 RepID=A0AAN9BR03_9CAEN